MASARGKTALAFARTWHHVDATDRTLGNLATRIAWVLMGKHKGIYDPSVDAGDYLTITNALHVRLSGNKSKDKVYRHYSGFMGGLKEVPVTRMGERRPEDIIRKAVSTMLPKNTFRDRRLARLKIFPGDANGYDGNVVRIYGRPPNGENVESGSQDVRIPDAVTRTA